MPAGPGARSEPPGTASSATCGDGEAGTGRRVAATRPPVASEHSPADSQAGAAVGLVRSRSRANAISRLAIRRYAVVKNTARTPARPDGAAASVLVTSPP